MADSAWRVRPAQIGGGAVRQAVRANWQGQAYYVPAGAVVRLQAGPYESRARGVGRLRPARSPALLPGRGPLASTHSRRGMPCAHSKRRAHDGRSAHRQPRQRRLGAIGNAQPGLLDHRNVVGAVADRHNLDAQARAGRAPRPAHHAWPEIDYRGPRSVRSACRRVPRTLASNRSNPICSAIGATKAVKPPETRIVSAPSPAWSGPASRAGIGPDPLGQALLDDALRPALAAARPARESAGEIQFALHRPLGDLGDLGLEPGIVGQLVDAFLPDHGRIHVGDQQLLLARPGGWAMTSTPSHPS